MTGDSVPRGRIVRAAPLAALTARTLCGRVIAGLRETAGAGGAVAHFDEQAARRYAELLGRSRGVLMKAGQILSMCDTNEWGGGGFGRYAEALSLVHLAVPKMDADLVTKLIHAELNYGDSQFAEWDAAPIATASIGQVHRAVLTDGRKVAVKVQYPGVANAIDDDLANVQLLTTFLRIVATSTALRVNVDAVARETAARIREEIDYRHEAANLQIFTELYKDHPFIRIPEFVPVASGPRVLTMTYLDGMDWTQAQQADSDLRNTWAEAIMRFACTNLQLAGLLHADPHPNNYRFFPDGTVGFLDFGCIQILTERRRSGWTAMLQSALKGHKDDLYDLMEEMGFLDTDPTLTAEDLYGWACDLLHDIIVAPQPVTFTSASRARAVRSLLDFRDPEKPLTRITYPKEIASASRILLNLTNIFVALNATLPIRAITNDIHGLAQPVTTLGQQHHDWIRRRQGN